KWIEVAPDFAYGYAFGLRQLRGDPVPLSGEEESTREALQAEFDRLSKEYDGADELPEKVDERLAELETALEGFESRPLSFEPSEVSRAGAFVSITHDGGLRVERGYVRSEDELPAEPESHLADGDGDAVGPSNDADTTVASPNEAARSEPDED